MWENLTPREAIDVSRQRVQGHRFKIWKRLGLWLSAILGFSMLNAGLLTALAGWLIPREVGNLALLVVRVGTLLLVYAGLSLVVRVFSAVSFTVILCDGYRRLSATQANLPTVAPQFTASAFTTAAIPRPLRGKLLVLGALALVLWLGLAQWNNSPEIDHALVIAHRGSSHLAPENSVSAIQQAILDRADWVEIDVQETLDGAIVVTHDSDLMKLANFPKKIWETSLAELQNIPIGRRWGPQFADERVPTLQQVLQAARGQVKVLIELKYYGHEQHLEQRVIDIVEKEQMMDEVMFMSLKPNGIAKLRQLRPQWRCGLLLSVSVGDLEKIDVDFFAVNARFATRELIRRIHRRGRDVFAWTVDEPALLSTLINRDIDGVITNRPDVAREVLTLRSEMSLGERLLTEAAALFRVNRDQVLEEH
jgi:glycerophosphoryl diester phosphodiesterase